MTTIEQKLGSTINNQCLCDCWYFLIGKEKKNARTARRDIQNVQILCVCAVICQPPASISTTDWLTDKLASKPCELGINTHVPFYMYIVQRTQNRVEQTSERTHRCTHTQHIHNTYTTIHTVVSLSIPNTIERAIEAPHGVSMRRKRTNKCSIRMTSQTLFYTYCEWISKFETFHSEQVMIFGEFSHYFSRIFSLFIEILLKFIHFVSQKINSNFSC